MLPGSELDPSREIEIRAYAKINLFLQVTGKRDDGYHLLHSLMCGVSLFDTLRLRVGGAAITVTCDHPQVPCDRTNLVYQAATIFFDRLEEQGKLERDVIAGVQINLNKKIPVGAGLGGGSSDAAAVLSGLNQIFNRPFSNPELRSMGVEIGADVPFFLFGRPALASGIGEQLVAYEGLRARPVLLINPGFSVSTAMVYKKLNLGLTDCKKNLKKTNFKGFRFIVPDHLCNDLETVTAEAHPELEAIKKSLIARGAKGALMSGSGPTIFGLFEDSQRAQEARRYYAHQDRLRCYLAHLLV